MEDSAEASSFLALVSASHLAKFEELLAEAAEGRQTSFEAVSAELQVQSWVRLFLVPASDRIWSKSHTSLFKPR